MKRYCFYDECRDVIREYPSYMDFSVAVSRLATGIDYCIASTKEGVESVYHTAAVKAMWEEASIVHAILVDFGKYVYQEKDIYPNWYLWFQLFQEEKTRNCMADIVWRMADSLEIIPSHDEMGRLLGLDADDPYWLYKEMQ